MVDDGKVELIKFLLLNAHFVTFDHGTRDVCCSLLNHLLILFELGILVLVIVVEFENVGLVAYRWLIGAKAELLVEPIGEITFTFPIALLLQRRLNINLKLFRVAPRTALILHYFFGNLHHRILSLLLSATVAI